MANFGDSFWSGAKAGADMAGKWVNTYNTSVDRRREDAFREGSKAIETDWQKAQEHAGTLSNEAERAKYLNDARRSMQDSYRSLAYETKGTGGVDIYGKHVMNMDNTEAMLNNADFYQNNTTYAQKHRDNYAGKIMGVINAAKAGNPRALKALGSVASLYGGATVNLSKDGLLTWGPEGEQVPVDMDTATGIGSYMYTVADALSEYFKSRK